MQQHTPNARFLTLTSYTMTEVTYLRIMLSDPKPASYLTNSLHMSGVMGLLHQAVHPGTLKRRS